MKLTSKIFILSALMHGSFSAFASTGATSAINCKVSELWALEGDNDLYARVICERGKIDVVAKSESVKSVLQAAKVSDKTVYVLVDADDAFKKTETSHKIWRVELH